MNRIKTLFLCLALGLVGSVYAAGSAQATQQPNNNDTQSASCCADCTCCPMQKDGAASGTCTACKMGVHHGGHAAASKMNHASCCAAHKSQHGQASAQGSSADKCDGDCCAKGAGCCSAGGACCKAKVAKR
jgi:hypothetical protein